MEISYKFRSLFEILSTDKKYEDKYKDIRYIVLVGGRGSGKSYALAAGINTASYNKGWGFLFTRWTMVSAATSIIPEFLKQADALNNENDFIFIKSRVVNTQSNAVIDYKGIKPQSSQSSGALKSVSGKNVFIVEEAEDCPDFELFDKIDNSIRTIDHKNLIILCLNQGHVNHWLYTEFIKEKRDDVLILESTYLDNLKNLDKSFIKKAEREKKRNLKRYRHIYLNEWQDSVDGALWLQSDISVNRISVEDYKNKIESDIVQIVVAFDPAVTDEKKNLSGQEPDEDGIMIVAKDRQGHCYVLKDLSCRGKRSEISKIIVGAYKDYNANFIVIEKNNGGDWIPTVIKSVDKYVRIKTVTATKGKKLRAEPVQARYEEGEVHHVGHLSELEFEMTTWVPDMGMKSPGKIDSLVWGITALTTKQKQFKVFTT